MLADNYSPKDFLSGFMKLYEDTEVPPTFAAWSAIAGLSCILGRRCFLECGPFNIYPNMYICLVGGSGVVRKSTSIDAISTMLRLVQPGPNIIAQKLTPEALIEAMKIVNTENPKEFMKTTCTGFVVADELATFLNKQSYEAGIAPLLIQFFDCKPNFEYRTKTGGQQILTDTCLGLLAGTTVDWLSSAIPTNAVGGGLTSRIIFVYVEKEEKMVPFPEFTDAHKHLAQTLLDHLHRLSQIQGKYVLTPDAKEWYAGEYIRFKTSEDGHTLSSNPTLSGYASRRHLHQLKLAMLLAAAESTEMVVKLEHLKVATTMLSGCEKKMPDILNMVTSSDLGILQRQFVDLIRKSQGRKIAKSTILRSLGHRISLRELDEIVNSLKAARLVTEWIEAGDSYYQWTGD